MTTRLVTQEVTKSPTRLAAGLPIPLLLMPLETDLRLLRGVGSATFTRSTIGTFVDKDDGLVKTAAIDAARFEQNGILIEGASTNLLLRSEEFDNAIWVKNGDATILADQTAAPDGITTADLLTASAGGPNRISQNISANTGSNTFPIFVKQNDATHINMRIVEGGGVDGNVDFSFASGTFGTPSAGIDSTNVEVLTNGWFRISITVTTSSTGVINFRCGGEISSSSTGTKTFIWGGMDEQPPFASSYIKTVASTVTKADEDTDIDAANIPAPTADYTISMEVDSIGFDSSLSQVLFNVAGETSRRITWNTTTGAIEATHGAVISVSTSTFSAGDRVKISFAVDATNQTLIINGVQEDQDAKGTVTGTATAINIGHQAGINQAFSHIKPLRIDNTALTVSQAGAL